MRKYLNNTLFLMCAALLFPAAGIRAQDASPEAPPAEAVVVPEAPIRTFPRQVLITASILEWAHDSTLDYGFTFQYTKPAGSTQDLESAFAALPRHSRLNQGATLFLDRIRDDSGSYSGVISALDQLGSVRILSEPRVVVLCRKDYEALDPALRSATDAKLLEARVSSASKIPYETAQVAGTGLAQITEFQDTGIQLTVSVEDIIQDEFVKIRLNSSVTDLSGFVSVALNKEGDPLPTPKTFTRKIDNTVLVRDNSLFMTGILKTTSQHTREQGVPWFSRIPVVGYLFKNRLEKKSDQELLFLVRPRILQD